MKRLTFDQVHRIRSSGCADVALAEEMGVSLYTVRTARSGHLARNHPTPPVRRRPGLPTKPDLPCEFKPELFSIPGEEWRPIPGWERHYRASSLGRVYSLHQTGRIATGMEVRGGYRVLKLRSEGKRAHVAVHCLVLAAFVGPRPSPEHQGCHNDGEPRNNRLDNLRWDTIQGNADDRKKHGTNRGGRPRLSNKPGENHG